MDPSKRPEGSPPWNKVSASLNYTEQFITPLRYSYGLNNQFVPWFEFNGKVWLFVELAGYQVWCWTISKQNIITVTFEPIESLDQVNPIHCIEPHQKLNFLVQ